MATRSPTVSHAYWGSFVAITDLPNVAGSPTQKSTLEAGDQAYVPSSPYVCTDATLGAAVWFSVGAAGGTLLWEWNGIDTAQFDTPKAYDATEASWLDTAPRCSDLTWRVCCHKQQRCRRPCNDSLRVA